MNAIWEAQRSPGDLAQHTAGTKVKGRENSSCKDAKAQRKQESGDLNSLRLCVILFSLYFIRGYVLVAINRCD
jgi:hypothetical protein